MSYALLKNPNKHFYTTRQKDIRWIVLHVTAGLEDLDMEGVDESAEATNRYGATTTRAASWHSCVDSDSIEPALPDEYTAFHCINYNSPSLGIEISNRDARWNNKPADWVAATLLNAARVTHEWERKHGIPRVMRTKREVDAGMAGYTNHMFLDPARRRDPGADFPLDQFFGILEQLDSGFVVPVPTPVIVETNRPAPKFPLEKGYYFGPKSGPKESVSGYYSHRADLKKWQTQMAKRGWDITADGYYGDETRDVAKAFKIEKGLGTSGRIGSNAWRFAWTAPLT